MVSGWINSAFHDDLRGHASREDNRGFEECKRESELKDLKEVTRESLDRSL